MQGIVCLDFCRALCCVPGSNGEKTPLIQTVVTRSRKKLAGTQNRNKSSKYCIPLTKTQEHNVSHTALSRQRQFIINELVETERRYVKRLTILEVEFMQVLVKLELNCDPLRKLFTQIQMLKKISFCVTGEFIGG